MPFFVRSLYFREIFLPVKIKNYAYCLAELDIERANETEDIILYDQQFSDL